LGGLLSAYDLSDDVRLLRKAQELADRILPAFDTPNKIPCNGINLLTYVQIILFLNQWICVR